MTSPLHHLSNALADRYRIERELGAGGMATVYLAHDLRHDRKVALKVLRPELAAVIGADRFLAEIKTTANLQHPHILPLLDSGDAAGSAGERSSAEPAGRRATEYVYYVMPFVEGESLRDRLTREKQLPVADALGIAREVADALEYAHAHGVIHRDIKPENILLHGGHALVADFGIALAASRSEGGARMTETGMSLGTPHYMSPEQAMGEREVTARSDVYALGCVLYEMLSGEPPFTGPTAQAIVARVMTDVPRPLSLHRRTVPGHVEAAVMTALQKLPADRFASAAAFAAALANPAFAVAQGAGPAAGAGSSRWRARLPWAVAILALAAGAVLSRVASGGGAGAPPARFALTLPSETSPVAVALSPDGSTIAYVALDGARYVIFTRRLDELTPRRVEGSDNAETVRFSPDGEWLVYVTGGQARKVPRRGGTSVPVPFRSGATIISIVYAGPDRFVATLGDGSLASVGSDGAVKGISGTGSVGLDLCQVLPDGWVLARELSRPPNGTIVAVDPASGRRIPVLDQVVAWAEAGEGFLAWALPDGSLFAAPFDAAGKRLTGTGHPVGGTAQVTLGYLPAIAVLGQSMVYVPSRPRILARVNRAGVTSALISTGRSYHSPRISPDGRRVALDFSEQQRDIWLFDLVDSTLTRFGFDSSAHDPTWLPDGSGLLFAGFRGSAIGVFRRRLEGPPAAESLLVAGVGQVSVHTVTPDGKTAVGAQIGMGSLRFDLVRLSLGPLIRLDTLLSTAADEIDAVLSPDGRLLAYVSDESGRPEVYVRSFPGMTSKVQVSQDGGSEPVWARNGRELFYRSLGEGEPMLMAAEVSAVGGFRIVARRPLFGIASYEGATPHANYDVFPDGRSFVMVRQGRPGQQGEIVYLQNLKGLLAGQGR